MNEENKFKASAPLFFCVPTHPPFILTLLFIMVCWAHNDWVEILTVGCLDCTRPWTDAVGEITVCVGCCGFGGHYSEG